MSTKQEKLDKLLEWAVSHGTEVMSSIAFKVDPKTQQVSAVSTRAIPKDELLTKPLIRVPESLSITPTLAEQVFGDSICGSGDRTRISKLLLAKLRFDKRETTLDIPTIGEVNGNEFFKPFIEILPTGKETGSPLFWDGVERELLKGTNAYLALDKCLYTILDEWYSTITKLPKTLTEDIDLKSDASFYDVFRNAKTEQFATYLNQVEGNVSWCSFPTYLWAHAIFSSRAFPYILQHESPIREAVDKVHDLNEAMLIPVSDLLNHESSATVKWGFDGEKYSFSTLDEVTREGQELFSNYGAKSNESLLFQYGFVLADNKEDYLTLALRIPDEQVKDAEKFGVKGFKGNDIVFNFRGEDGVDEELMKLFQFLVKNKWEDGVTLRNSLEGLKQLGLIVHSKIDTIKSVKAPQDVVIDPYIIGVCKTYRHLQKKHLQKTIEEILKIEKNLIKQYKPESFKSFFKNDQTFANALLLTFGIDTYEKLISSEDDLAHVLNLWILRVGNKKSFVKAQLPEWVYEKFLEVSKRANITQEDVKETLPAYRALFPKLSEKIPEVFGAGDWSIKNFIIAEKVKSEIVFIRETSNEAYFVRNTKL